MSEKHVVVQGATLKCKFSVDPKTDILKVKTHSKHYANDKVVEKKLIATDKEIGQTLEKDSFGKCKLRPNGSGDYLLCQVTITKWSGPCEKITLSNKGKILVEDSKATCLIGGADCIEVDKHGQKAEVAKQHIEKANPDVLKQINPLLNPKDLEDNSSDFN